MQLVKRFTQCGSLTMLFAIFMILFGVSSTALTTFGKTQNNPQPPTVPPAKGRDCNNHNDCATLQDTSCVKDPNDGKTRCLCGDNTAPYNGQCSTKIKGLRHLCTQNADCSDGMVCSTDNVTKSVVTKLVQNQQDKDKMKMCLCDEENGYEENFRDFTCNGAITQICVNHLVPVLTMIFSYAFPFLNAQLHNVN